MLETLQARLRYFDGHSDTLGLFADGEFLRRIAGEMAAPFAGSAVAKVAGIEARGFVLAPLVAMELGAGFIAIRKGGDDAGIHPGPKIELAAGPDWRGRTEVLALQRHVVDAGDRVLVVDDWAETGVKALTARQLVERCGGVYAGLSLLVDQLPDDVRDALGPVAAIALAEQVRPR